MTREIKFRAWLKKENCMVDPVTGLDLTAPYATVQWFNNVHDALENKVSDCWMEDCELMQYTGLKDKNGKEIYEGDLLADQMSPHLKPMFVRWDDEGAQFMCIDTKRSEIATSLGYVHGIAKERLSVQGNIYETAVMDS